MDQSKQPGLQIDQVLLLEAHFAHRKDALAIPSTTPIANLPINLEAKVAGNSGDKSIAVMLRASTPEDETLLYSFRVEIAVIVSAVPGEENLDPFEYGRDMGAAAFFPFLREAIANLTLKGRFGAVWLKPLNFVALEAAHAAPAPRG